MLVEYDTGLLISKLEKVWFKICDQDKYWSETIYTFLSLRDILRLQVPGIDSVSGRLSRGIMKQLFDASARQLCLLTHAI